MFYKIVIGVSLFLASILWLFLSDIQPNYQWVQMVANNQLSVRVILVNKNQCPTVDVDNKPTKMNLRAVKTTNFPAVCELLVSRDARSIKIGQQTLPILPTTIKQIAILGDTGCRINKLSVQACNDEKAWPLRRLSTNLAEKKPDLILHVGDYFYREAPCPEGNKGCKGSPSGYNWGTWNADWFSPANSLLQSSVMAFSRGNHEDCNRAHNGWFRYLSPWSYKEKGSCVEMEDPYVLKLENINAIMFDSSYGRDDKTSNVELKQYKEAIKQLKIDKNLTNILLTHRPMWTHYKNSFGNLTQQIAFKNLLPDNTLLISGHAHYLQLLDMQTDYDQIVIGNSGTELNAIDNMTQKLVNIKKHIANFVYSRSGFGYAILTNFDKDFVFYNQDGGSVGQCSWKINQQYSSLDCQ